MQSQKATQVMSKNVLLANNEWIEVTPSVKVSGPSHEVFLVGVVSNQPENDPEDIRVDEEQKRILVKRKNDKEEDRIFTITYRVQAHGQDTFANTQVIVRKA